jgi:hypothetical protein
MNVSVIDLFWLILKFLAALGLIALLFGALYVLYLILLIALGSFRRFLKGTASNQAIVGWVLILVATALLVIGVAGNFGFLKQ